MTLEPILNRINLTAIPNKQNNVKCKVIHAHSIIIAPLIRTVGTISMRGVSFTAWPAYPRGKQRVVCPSAGHDILEKRKISYPSRESTPDCSAHILVTAPSKACSHRTYKIRRSSAQFHMLNEHLEDVTT
jgi:hypothetical protein